MPVRKRKAGTRKRKKRRCLNKKQARSLTVDLKELRSKHQLERFVEMAKQEMPQKLKRLKKGEE